MTDQEFQAFYMSLPTRTKLLVRSGYVDWRKVLPQFINK